MRQPFFPLKTINEPSIVFLCCVQTKYLIGSRCLLAQKDCFIFENKETIDIAFVCFSEKNSRQMPIETDKLSVFELLMVIPGNSIFNVF